MPSVAQLIIWIVLSPIALITCIACIVIIAHYKPYYHGTDISLFSIFIAMSLRVVIVILLPSIMELANLGWTLHLCNFYVWAFIALHIAELLSFVTASIHWMSIPRSSTKKKIYNSSKYVKIVISLVWFFAIVIGIVPVIEWSENFQGFGECRFLPYNLGTGFSVFFIIINVFSFTMSLICTCDTMVLFSSMKRVATNKYQAGRFYLPSSASVAKTASQTVHAKYNELNFSSDLCRLVVILIICAFTIIHIPFTVIEFYQLVDNPDREILEIIILWLILIEALILPHLLWLVSKRYRHALVYTWKVHILRDITAQEEDPSACTLQSYTRKIRDVDGKTVRITTKTNDRNTILPHKDHVYTNGDTTKMNGYNTNAVRNSESTVNRNGRPSNIVITDIDDGMTVATNNGNANAVVNLTMVKNSNGTPQKDPTSPTMSTLSTPSHADLERSASSNSRKEWKEQMRRKHLPAIFVNEAFDDDQTALPRDEKNEFYMSSDYHPDYLTNSLPRSVVKTHESESEGASNQYDDDDIDHILELDKDKSSTSEQCMILDISDDESSIREPSIQGDNKDPLKEAMVADLNDIFLEDKDNLNPSICSESPKFLKPEDMAFESSDKSVTIEPYTAVRRPPWMDVEEETTSFQSSQPSSVKHVTTDPYDNDIDRGFEEALAAGYASSMAGYSTMALGFDSIKEESEETNSQENLYSPFKTQAVNGFNSRSSSQTSSENPFDSVPMSLPPSTTKSFDSKDLDEHYLPPLTNGYGDSVSSFKPSSPPEVKTQLSRDRHSLDSQSSVTSQEVANISKAALIKQEQINGSATDTTAYF
ncbi:uncharacterized protein LOC126826700 [Patella vulgata]|uniref:uncharacterized protein LOC126826700 n=1 Tax=Patella vulgata TaxID=6465 RepID=UPI0021802728|nr:uncharacterized protein LOC126826700 [Patella vulgata]